MQDFLKKTFNLGFGALVVTREKVEEVEIGGHDTNFIDKAGEKAKIHSW